uniref:FERM, ARHGEF and pleckstrin domain-containing protein 1 n=1 Tax=Ursus maritimus TaxID=29073 RepID=A0A452VMQ6_URSMA
MGEIEQRPSPGSRLGAPENSGISTLEHGQKPPPTPSGKLMSIKIQMLDDTQEAFEVPQRAPGKVLLDAVCNHLNLVEGDYFGLEFPDHKKITVSDGKLMLIFYHLLGPKHVVVKFVVKFFPPDHTQLQEELTRYLFALQVKQDLAQGRLTCNDTSAALLISHIVQSEIGDFDEASDREHLAKNKYIPQQDALEDKIVEFHHNHIGQTPAESDFQLLEIARRLEMYGIRLHPAKDREGSKINLAVANTGILVFQGFTKINAFNWAKVRKLSFKRKRFLIKLRPDANSSYQDTLEFLMASRDFCKSFWKICVEHHAFFRLFEEPKPKPKPVLFTIRSQKELLFFFFLSNTSHPPIGSLTGSPHLSELSINSQGGAVPASVILSPNLSPDTKQASPLVSPLLNDQACPRTDDEEEGRRKKFPTDKAYFIAKEVSTTERTYLKDLEVITSWFQSTVSKEDAMPEALKSLIFPNFEPLHKFHTSFLKETEQRLALWEGRSNAGWDACAPVSRPHQQLAAHLWKHSEALEALETGIRSSRRLETVCRDFELQKVCYLPLNTFLLRPLHRLMHYKSTSPVMTPSTHDRPTRRAALAEITEMVAQLHGTMIKMENFQKLHELKKDLIGIDNLVIPGREFIRLGSLSKLSGKGLQQRMFFLFNDVLLYTSRGLTASNQFKVHGQLPLYGLTIEESEDEWGVPHCLTLRGQRQSIVVAASSRSEMEKWVEDIQMAIDLAEKSSGPTPEFLASSPPDNKSPDEAAVADQESEDDLSASRTSLERQAPHRGNTMVHVCWHRNTSVSMVDFSVAVENQLSGNLLRKFKNSTGWQKLWVVFTNFCLFFYKSHQDNHPLASLPLLGYSLTIPSEAEDIHKDYVFKLHFKSHVYYFRAESEYTFERWMEVIRSATSSASRAPILSHKESHVY